MSVSHVQGTMPSERYKDEQDWSWMSGNTQTSRTTAVNIVPRGKRRLLLNTVAVTCRAHGHRREVKFHQEWKEGFLQEMAFELTLKDG